MKQFISCWKNNLGISPVQWLADLTHDYKVVGSNLEPNGVITMSGSISVASSGSFESKNIGSQMVHASKKCWKIIVVRSLRTTILPGFMLTFKSNPLQNIFFIARRNISEKKNFSKSQWKPLIKNYKSLYLTVC